MKIAQVAPLTEAVPPHLYGGTERVVAFLTDELVRCGHDVTLFASGDSRTSAHLVASWPRALRKVRRSKYNSPRVKLKLGIWSSDQPEFLFLPLMFSLFGSNFSPDLHCFRFPRSRCQRPLSPNFSP